jgi:hypothetical protein
MEMASPWEKHIWATNEVVIVQADRSEIVNRLEQYLLDKKVTLWLSWDIHNAERRRQAAEFIYDLMADVRNKVRLD